MVMMVAIVVRRRRRGVVMVLHGCRRASGIMLESCVHALVGILVVVMVVVAVHGRRKHAAESVHAFLTVRNQTPPLAVMNETGKRRLLFV